MPQDGARDQNLVLYESGMSIGGGIYVPLSND